MEGGTGTVRHLCVTMDGYMRRGKAGLTKGMKDLGWMIAICVNVRCVGVLV
jgi:hypothetical protein